MSNERSRDRGNLFENTQKKKPSQPDLQGDCTIDAIAYEIRGWRRGDQVTISLAPPREEIRRNDRDGVASLAPRIRFLDKTRIG